MKVSATAKEDNYNNRRSLWPMISGGLLVLTVGWLLTRYTISRVGQLNDMIIFGATFAPLWLGGAIGGTVAYRAVQAKVSRTWLPPVIAAFFTVPVILSDPWIIVSLGLGNSVLLGFRIILLLLPVFFASIFAYPGLVVSERVLDADSFSIKIFRLTMGMIVLILTNVVIYLIIYWWIIPRGNFVGLPSS